VRTSLLIQYCIALPDTIPCHAHVQTIICIFFVFSPSRDFALLYKVDSGFTILIIFKPKWSVCMLAVLVQPSSAIAKRVFSLLNNLWIHQQTMAVSDMIKVFLLLNCKSFAKGIDRQINTQHSKMGLRLLRLSTRFVCFSLA
jgi:hypothetical protein